MTSAVTDTHLAAATPTTREILERIKALQPLLAGNAEKGEEDRRVPEESIRALTEAGIFRITQPKRYGGYEMPVHAQLEVFAAVAEGDGGAGWVVTLCNQCAWMTALFPQRAQDEVWKSNPDARVSGVVTPSSTATKVDGGYRITGKWYYNSGSWHSDWAVLGFPIVDEDGEKVDHGIALIPREDLGFEETWFVAGMRSSGSNCLVAEGVLVPEHRVISAPDAWLGKTATEHVGEALYRSAFTPTFALGVVAPQLGLGRKMLEIVLEKASSKPVTFTVYMRQTDSAVFKHQIAEAAMLIDTAHLHAFRAADEIDRHAREGTFPNEVERARFRADASWVVENITKAINLLLFAHGAASFAESNVLQRIWRDSAVAARHAYTLPAVSLEMYGTALLSRDEAITSML